MAIFSPDETQHNNKKVDTKQGVSVLSVAPREIVLNVVMPNVVVVNVVAPDKRSGQLAMKKIKTF